MIGRIGIFFLFVGLVAMWIYFATDFSNEPVFLLFLAALGMIFLGIALIRRDYKPPPPSSRFRLFRRKNKSEKQDRES
jgi:hypothetical protein